MLILIPLCVQLNSISLSDLISGQGHRHHSCCGVILLHNTAYNDNVKSYEGAKGHNKTTPYHLYEYSIKQAH
jgi:hypothetical protein